MVDRADGTRLAALRAWGDALRTARRTRRMLGRRIALAGGGIALLAVTIAAPPLPRIVWNASASAPVGLYAVSPRARVEVGDMVIARLPEPWQMLAAGRRYLPENVPLVKRVTAGPGDEVCALGQSLFVNGKWTADRRFRDRAGRIMPWWDGCVRLHARQYLLLMPGNAASFDGRYFGLTGEALLLGKARLLWAR